MTAEQIDRVFGRGRLKMATGEHVEVFREAVAPGERRRYTKRFLATRDGDFGQWTEREWRILARLIGHGIRCVPDVVQFDGGAMGGRRLVQTYDAGVTIDQWATLLPIARNGKVRRHVFEDCAHWWALAHHCLAALNEIHALALVHLDIKGDNICIPYGPPDFDPDFSQRRLHPVFPRLALIDFAFSLISRESLATPLPIGWEKDYDYQSPRLLRALEAGRSGDLEPTKALDWRCDFYSLAAMLRRYLPLDSKAHAQNGETGWTRQRYEDARTLIYRLRESHDRDLTHWRPHAQLMDLTAARLAESDLAASLDDGWTLDRDTAAKGVATPLTPITPMTRIAPPEPVRAITPMTRLAPSERSVATTPLTRLAPGEPVVDPARMAMRTGTPTALAAEPEAARARLPWRRLPRAKVVLFAMALALAAFAAPSFVGDPANPLVDHVREALATVRSMLGAEPSDSAVAKDDVAAPLPSQPSDADQVVASANRSPTPAEEPAAAEALPVQEQAAAPSTPVEEPAAAAATQSVDEPKTAAATAREEASTESPALPDNKKASSPVAMVRAKPGASAHTAPSAKRSSRASTIAARRSRVLASAHADSVRSSSRRSPPQIARFKPSPMPVQIAAAKPTAPSPQASGRVLSVSSESNRPSIEPRAQSMAAANQPVAAQLTTATRDDSNVSAGTSQAGAEATPGERLRAQVGAPKQPLTVPVAQPREQWLAVLDNVVSLLRNRDGAPAPIEERSAGSSGVRPAARSTPDVLAQVTASPRMPVDPAPAATPPAPVAKEPTPARARAVPPLTADPAPTAEPARAEDDSQDALLLQAKRMLADTVPRIAAQAQADVSRVLGAAAHANDPFQAQAVVEAAHARWASESAWIPATNGSPAYARRLHDDARRAFASSRNVSDAVTLELRAFATNPRDPDIARYLADLHLRMNPPQAETARQLTLHAIAVSGSRRSARSDDWRTLAVASALMGRETDAIRAFQAEVALTNDVEGSCRAALDAYASFGERLRVPVQAMLYRVQSLGPAHSSCAWPRQWRTAMRPAEED